VARRLRTRSIARREARTIVTCPKSTPPRTLPPAVGRPKTRRRFSADYVFGAGRPKCRQPRPGKQGGLCPTMFSVRPRPPAPLSSTRLGAYCGVAALGSGCAADRRRGAECVVFQGFLSVAPLQSLCSNPYKANVGVIVGLIATFLWKPSHIGHVRVALLLSDVCRYRAR
jgi:hypothetical protein